VAAGLRRLGNGEHSRPHLQPPPPQPDPNSSPPLAMAYDMAYGHRHNLIRHTPWPECIHPLARTTIRRICGAPSLGDIPPERRSLACPRCGLPAGGPEALERHVAQCPNGGARHLMHHGLIKTLCGIVEESGVPKATIVQEAMGL